ncbi:MAG: hypothetical protein QOI81_1323 [Actinomycetota bacterium]|jgi:hypothetical protein|nr:hypothetical protein [Actinomycetota bacterium]
MDPILIGRKRLRAPLGSRGGGVAPIALAGLLALVAGAGALQASAHPPLAPAAVFRPVAAVSYLSGTHVATPPATTGLHAPVLRHGAFTFRLAKGTSPLTAAQSQQLFAYFVDVMAKTGWTLQASGNPTATGEWTMNWTLGAQTALITMTTAPKDLFEVDLCPPNPYC